ncbi:MAG: mechanosensitive ion channel [Desulfobacterium sp.]|jgi:miniconductance mechanosensitive channel|nr:mechanosensitive ion channel [Desulfobacterium sp.]
MERTRNFFQKFIMEWLETYIPEYADLIFTAIALIWIIFFSLVLHFVLHRLVIKWAGSRVTASRMIWQKALFENKLFNRLAFTFQGIIIEIQAGLWLSGHPDLLTLVNTITRICILIFGTLTVFSLLDALLEISRRNPKMRHFPFRGLVQGIKLVSSFLIGLVVLAMLMGKSPLILLSGLGAVSAVMMLVFKDPILGFVAGIQLSANDMLAVGDWLEMPKFNADGDVIDISLTTVKVRNWDKTITTIPAYTLISDSFKNWRGMSESGGRRIKRSLYLEISSVGFLDENQIEELNRITLLSPYLAEKAKELESYNDDLAKNSSSPVNNRRLTNIGTLRAYMVAYLKSHPRIHQQMTLMVRQLAPGPDGLPMEIYAFTNTTNWVEYENIQADIFDHFFAILPQFGIRAHETPTGNDIRWLKEPERKLKEES